MYILDGFFFIYNKYLMIIRKACMLVLNLFRLRIFYILIGLTSFHFSTNAQNFPDTLAANYKTQFQKNNFQDHIQYLTSDICNGRLIGSKGEKKAAEYLSNEFKKSGASYYFSSNTFFQKFIITPRSLDAVLFNSNDTLSSVQHDFLLWQGSPVSLQWDNTVNLDKGYQIVNDSVLYYEKEKVYDQVLIIEDGWPRDSVSYNQGDKDNPDYSKIQHYVTQQPKAILWKSTVYDDFQNMGLNVYNTDYILYNRLSNKKEVPVLIVPSNFEFNGRELTVFSRKDTSLNVVGMIEGSDSKLKNEWVIVTAHYDHLGTENGQYYPGADDNASGCAALLEMTSVFNQMKKDGVGPKRSVLLVAFSGEEFGLLGSSYFTQTLNIAPKNISAVLNMDMLGRRTQNTDKNDHIYTIGGKINSPELQKISNEVNKAYFDFEIDETYDSKDHPDRIYYRSDQINFVKLGIPSLMYFSGLHGDYHSLSDTEEKIDYEHLINITQLVWMTAYHIANKDEKLKFEE